MRAQGTVLSVPHALAYNDFVLGIYCLQACDMHGAVKLTLHTCAPAAPSYARRSTCCAKLCEAIWGVWHVLTLSTCTGRDA